jgi:hypothetical protein
MNKENAIKLFEDKKVRTLWDADQERWYISVIDVIEILTKSVNPRDYWFKMRWSRIVDSLSTVEDQATI